MSSAGISSRNRDGCVRLVLAEHAPPGGAGQHEPLARPREADVAEPPFLLDFLLVLRRARVREQAFFHAGDDDERELEALGGVHRHQPDAGVLGAVLFVGFRKQRQPIDESAE